MNDRTTAPDGAQTADIPAFEWPTWLLIFAIYGGWLLLTSWASELPWWLLPLLGGPLLCLHGSLQHEIVHHHPTRSEWLNTLLAYPPLSLWLPYPLYAASHRQHHEVPMLTCPVDDPESWYLTPEEYARSHWLRRHLLHFNNTFPGRMLLGPWICIYRCGTEQFRQILSGDRVAQRTWALHLLACLSVIWWLQQVGLPLWQYLLLFVWPGLSLTLMRSFHEHRVADDPNKRTAVVEASWPFRLLYLNNNYHVMHHRHPEMPWYRLPACYRDYKPRLDSGELGYRPGGYAAIAGRYFLHAVDELPHGRPAAATR